jgi:hypothetical protein
MKAQITIIDNASVNLLRVVDLLKTNIQLTLKQVGDFGLDIAKSKVPVYSGATREMINVIEFPNEVRIISQKASSDNKPVNVLIEEGNWEKLGWGKFGEKNPETGIVWHPSTEPLTGEFHFMTNTANLLRPYLKEKMEIAVARSLN